jgi:hypothetical protein
MEVRSAITGRRGISLPFTDECPVLGDTGVRAELYQAAIALGSRRKWRYTEFRGGSLPLPKAQPSMSFYGHEINLARDTRELLASVDSAHRRAIRKAESSSLAVEWSRSVEATRQFYSLLCLTRQRHGLPPQPWKFFAALHRNVISAGKGDVVLARHANKAVAGAVFLHFTDQALYKFGASDQSYQHLRGNNLVMWSAISKYASDGFRRLNLGRTSLRNDGLRRFKLGWGASETQISYFKYDYEKGDFTSGRDDSSGWHTRFFNIMPRRLAMLVGNLIYKHLA